jgi:hypothetical protein
LQAQIAHHGNPAPIQARRRCTERRRDCVDAYLALAMPVVTIRALLRAAGYGYRWSSRPGTPRIRTYWRTP